MSARSVFQLWSNQERFVRSRVDIVCPAYAQFRSAGRELQRQLLAREEDAAIVLLDSVHAILGEMATVPTDFNAQLSDRVGVVGGGVARMRNVWGVECARALEKFVERTREMVSTGSALQNAVVQALVDELDADLRFYCHRTAVESFCALGARPDQAIVTPDAYRKAGIFDVLLTVGPLRSMGYGRISEAVVTAPRFRRHQQVAWAPEYDEPEFGEAHTAPLGFDVLSHWDIQSRVISCEHRPCFNSSVDSVGENLDEAFDYEIRARIRRAQGPTIRGTVLRLSGFKSIMHRAGSHLAIYTIGYGRVVRKDAEDVLEGDVIVHHERFSLELGPIAPSDDPIVREWRDTLRIKYLHHKPLLLGSLRKAGLNLIHLDSAVRAWMCHQRPQQSGHFEIVSRVIGWDDQKARKLWRVFSEQHGAAVQHGLIVADLAAEALVKELNSPAWLKALAEFAASPTNAPLRLRVDVSGVGLEVLAYVVEEVESSDHLPEKLFDQITDAGRSL